MPHEEYNDPRAKESILSAGPDQPADKPDSPSSKRRLSLFLPRKSPGPKPGHVQDIERTSPPETSGGAFRKPSWPKNKRPSFIRRMSSRFLPMTLNAIDTEMGESELVSTYEAAPAAHGTINVSTSQEERPSKRARLD